MMDRFSDSAHTRRTTFAERAAPLAIAGVAAAAALATYLAWPARRTSAAGQRHQSLVDYLRDHLGGADTAIHVVRRLAAAHEGAEDGPLFRQLAEDFEQDRAAVRALLARLGASARSPKRVAGRASAAILGLAAGGRPGQLSLLLTLEAIAIGIQGKRCLWRALQTLSTTPAGDPINPWKLEARAIRQWEAVEERRRVLAAVTFPTIGSITRPHASTPTRAF
jgi:hypothetical protein